MIKNGGLDIGNITTVITTKQKTTITESRFKLATELNKLGGSTVFKTGNNEYLINEGVFENNKFKHQKQQYSLLLQYAVANAFCDNSTVNLCLGIPVKQFTPEHKKELAEVIRKNSNIDVRINNKRKRVSINRFIIRPESYGVYKTFESLKQIVRGIPTIVIDIGGGTTDISFYDHLGRFKDGTSIEKGLLTLYDLTKVNIFNNSGIQLSIEDIKEYVDGNFCLHDLNKDLHIPVIKTFFENLNNDITGIYPEISKYNIIVSGGGALRLGKHFKEKYTQCIIDESIETNSKAFYQICKQEFGEHEQ